MFALVLLLAPLIDSAPQPLHSHGPPPPCDTTICRVSDQTLNSALSTFLCFTEERTSAMEEIDKKRELAAAIAPYLDGSREEELVAMGSESLVSLVNLVLHAGSHKVVKKTKRQHLKDLISNMAGAGNFGLTPDLFKKVNPILLGLINCQTKTLAEIAEMLELTTGEDRAGRIMPDLFRKLFAGFANKIFNLVPPPPTTTAVPTTTTVSTGSSGSSASSSSTEAPTTVPTTEADAMLLPAINKYLKMVSTGDTSAANTPGGAANTPGGDRFG